MDRNHRDEGRTKLSLGLQFRTESRKDTRREKENKRQKSSWKTK